MGGSARLPFKKLGWPGAGFHPYCCLFTGHLPPMSAQILVVEKNEKIGGRICAQLREKGYEVRDCRNGPDVVLELRKNGVDVILLDNAIPMGAVKTARILRLHERYNHIPIGLPPEKERARVVIKEGGERDRPFPAEAVHAHRVAEEDDRSPGERRNGREANEPGSTGPGESENISILKAEYELLGITHADCGGELASTGTCPAKFVPPSPRTTSPASLPSTDDWLP